ncbi:MAG: septum formation initiator family protein [Eubacteriales bacterium]
MRLKFGRYFAGKKSVLGTLIRSFIAILLVFSVVFFMWSIMKYNKIREEQEEKDQYISRLNEEIDRLEYLVDMPLDDGYKIRIARERLGMCFPDEIIYYTNAE